MDEVTWTVTEPDGTVKTSVKKIAFIAPIKVSEGMTDDQKKFFNNYNTMQKELIKNNLMDPK